jgi:hypothetical protein
MLTERFCNQGCDGLLPSAVAHVHLHNEQEWECRAFEGVLLGQPNQGLVPFGAKATPVADLATSTP